MERSLRRFALREWRQVGLTLGLLFALSMFVAGCLSDETDKRGFGDGVAGSGVDCGPEAQEPANLANADLTATPRAARVAEILTLQATGAFVAPEGRYQRVVAELAGMQGHGLLPEGGASVVGCQYPDAVMLEFSDLVIDQVRVGEYGAWDKLNDLLGVNRVETHSERNFVKLGFDGLYNPPRVSREYAGLFGVVSARPMASVGDGNDTCLAIRDQDHFYILREAWGDCPSGCVNRHYTGVEVDESGNIREVGTWDGDGEAPAWFEEAEDCRSLFPEY